MAMVECLRVSLSLAREGIHRLVPHLASIQGNNGRSESLFLLQTGTIGDGLYHVITMVLPIALYDFTQSHNIGEHHLSIYRKIKEHEKKKTDGFVHD